MIIDSFKTYGLTEEHSPDPVMFKPIPELHCSWSQVL